MGRALSPTRSNSVCPMIWGQASLQLALCFYAEQETAGVEVDGVAVVGGLSLSF